VSFLKNIRENFYTQWSWWLLLLTFALTFFLPDRGAAKNLYRVLVALPVLLMLSVPVLKDFFANKSMRWFAAVSVYFSVTLIWSVDFRSIDNHLLRILSVWALAFLLYYLARFSPALFSRIDTVLVIFGAIWVVLLIADWESLWQVNPSFDRWKITRGAFSHHRHVGWMIAVFALLSIQRTFSKCPTRYAWALVSVVFVVVLFLAQARGGLLVFIAGLFTYFLIHSHHFNWRLVTTIVAGLSCIVGGIFILSPDLISSLVARGVAGRFSIWQNWISMWQETDIKMVFGYGLGASTENMIGSFTAKHFHNFYLNTIYYGGVVGFALTLGWFFSLAKFVYKEKALESPWIPVVVGVFVGFMTDGDRLFNYPGAFTFCFILPAFCLSFKDYSVVVEET
jgi:O-antigen ligase